MKSLSTSNRHLQTFTARKNGVERNVRSSSAIEGVSATTFRSAVNGRFLTKSDLDPRAPVVKGHGAKKK